MPFWLNGLGRAFAQYLLVVVILEGSSAGVASHCCACFVLCGPHDGGQPTFVQSSEYSSQACSLHACLKLCTQRVAGFFFIILLPAGFLLVDGCSAKPWPESGILTVTECHVAVTSSLLKVQ
jgi:hypothetical protein